MYHIYVLDNLFSFADLKTNVLIADVEILTKAVRSRNAFIIFWYASVRSKIHYWNSVILYFTHFYFASCLKWQVHCYYTQCQRIYPNLLMDSNQVQRWEFTSLSFLKKYFIADCYWSGANRPENSSESVRLQRHVSHVH